MPHAMVLELAGEKRPRYLGRYAHGLFFTLLARLDPDLAAKLHGAPRKPFTLAPLPEQSGALFLRFTTLDDALFSAFLEALLAAAPKGLDLGEDRFQLKRVLATPEGHPLARTATWAELRQAPARREAHLLFLTPTVFTTSKSGGRIRYTPLPDPRLILSSLLDKWQAHSPHPYTPREEAALRELFDLDAELGGFHHLFFHRVQAGKGFFPGFTGKVHLRLWSESLQAQEALGRLQALAFFSGVGAKTTYGMGLTRPLEKGGAGLTHPSQPI